MKINLSKNTKNLINWALLIAGGILSSVAAQSINNESTYERFTDELQQGKIKLRQID